MKILLIRPPFAVEKFYFPRFINEPLGLEYLSAFLSPGHQVKIVDAVAEGWNSYWQLPEHPEIIFQGLRPEQILNTISEYNPDAIGITWLFSTQTPSISLTAKIAKNISPKTPIIVGGPHPSASPVETLQADKNIDIVIYGEGEATLKEMFDAKMTNLKRCAGIAFRDGDEIKRTPPRTLNTNLDGLAVPDRQAGYLANYSKQFLYQSLYFRINKTKLGMQAKTSLCAKLSALPYADRLYYRCYNRKNSKKLPAADMITSRGCPNHCTFCAVHNIWGHTWRMRSAENVLEEIDLLVRRFGIRHINIQDDNFNVSKKRVVEICKGVVENKYDISFLPCSGSYVPALDEEVLHWLKKAGFHTLRMSIESGNQDILHTVIKKNINLSKVKGIVDTCRKLKIATEGAFIFGIPGETKKTMEETLHFAKSTGFDRIIRFIFQPFPNTELYETCLKNNYLTKEYDPGKAYVTGRRCFVKTEQFTPDDVLRIING